MIKTTGTTSTRRSRFTRRAVATAILAALALPLVAAAGSGGSTRGHDDDKSDGRRATFVTISYPSGQKLVLFGHSGARQVGLKGLNAGEQVVGIDVRPANNVLYGVSSANRVFSIDPRNGLTANHQTLSVPLSGMSFGVDFNPSVDRLRITSDTDQNLRVNIDTGATLMDTAIAYAAGDRNAAQNPAAVGVGYTYATLGAPTTLYDVDATTDTLALQNPPNAGTLNSIGPIGVDLDAQTGFDIAGVKSFTAYGLFQQGDKSRLYNLRFDRNGRASDTGIALRGSHTGLAVLDPYDG